MSIITCLNILGASRYDPRSRCLVEPSRRTIRKTFYVRRRDTDLSVVPNTELTSCWCMARDALKQPYTKTKQAPRYITTDTRSIEEYTVR